MHGQRTSSNCSNTAKADKRIDLLFARFAAIYGHIWRSQFKDEAFLTFAKKEWHEALEEFPDAVLIEATSNCWKEYDEFPPTLPQLWQACLQIKIKKNEKSMPLINQLQRELKEAQGAVHHCTVMLSACKTTQDQIPFEEMMNCNQAKIKLLEEQIHHLAALSEKK